MVEKSYHRIVSATYLCNNANKSNKEGHPIQMEL